nr:SRPBCC domain-containing protein [Pedobacter panaciterrae]
MESKKDLFITHLFDAPRELVFKAWTDPEQLKHWYAPDDCTIEFKHINVKEGGTFHSCIYDPIHGSCWIKGIYTHVIFPEKLVFSMILTNEHEDSVESLAAGKPEDWPKETITTVTFTSIGNQTKLSIHQTVPEEDAKQTGAYQSWVKMFNKLNNLIAVKNQ